MSKRMANSLTALLRIPLTSLLERFNCSRPSYNPSSLEYITSILLKPLYDFKELSYIDFLLDLLRRELGTFPLLKNKPLKVVYDNKCFIKRTWDFNCFLSNPSPFINYCHVVKCLNEI